MWRMSTRSAWPVLLVVLLSACLHAVLLHGFTLGRPELDSFLYLHPDLHVEEVHNAEHHEAFSSVMSTPLSKTALRQQGTKKVRQRLMLQCLQPQQLNKTKLPFCRFGPRWSQRIRALLERTWAPQTHRDLTEIAPDAHATHMDLASLTSKKLGACEEPQVERKRPMGNNATVIVFAALSEGAMCSAATTDWRKNLPVMLGKFLGARVIAYGHLTNTCSYCYQPDGEASPGCVEDILGGPDALVVVGSGPMFSAEHACKPEENQACQQQFFDLWQLLSTEWAIAAKQLIHITDANAQRPLAGMFNFDVVIDESHFVKPVNRCAREAMILCHQTWPALKLIYPGKISRENGQYEFLKLTDPRILEEYTIHFHGSDANTTEVEALKELARERKFLINIHGEVPQINFLHNLCSANGMVIYGGERNPAALYQGIAAGLPLFISSDTSTAYQRRVAEGAMGSETVSPKQLFDHPFFEIINRRLESHKHGAYQINQKLFDFVEDMGQDWMWAAKTWSDTFMDEEAVYHDICQRMCLCEGGPCTDKGGNLVGFSPRARVHKPPKAAEDMLDPEVAFEVAKVLLTRTAEQQLLDAPPDSGQPPDGQEEGRWGGGLSPEEQLGLQKVAHEQL